MKRLAMPALLACLSVFLAVPGCGTVTWPDVWGALKKCDNIDWTLASRVFADLVEVAQSNPAGEADLATLLAADTVGAVPCLLDYFGGAGGSTAKAATSFKAAHAPEVEKARMRGGPAAMRCPNDLPPRRPAAPAAGKDRSVMSRRARTSGSTSS